MKKICALFSILLASVSHADQLKTVFNPFTGKPDYINTSTSSGSTGIGSGFSYQKTITIDHTKVGAALTDFPVLISTISVTFSTITPSGHSANSSGFDIVFTTMSDCSFLLSWDTETYNASTGKLVAWVKVPSLSSTVDNVLYVCYGKSSITTYQGGPSSNTWTNNYEGVYHLGDTGLTVESSSHTLTATNNSVTTTTGKIGTGGSLNGSSAYLTAGAITDFNLTVSGSVSGWFNMGSGASGRNAIFGKDNFGTDRNGYFFFANQSVLKLCYELADASGFQQACETTALATTQAWHYGVLTWDSSNVKMYIDGSNDYSAAETKVPVSNVYVLSLGSRGDAAADFFNGTLDEMHLSRVARASGWISTEYNNQNSPDSFYSMGPETSSTGQIAYLNVPQTFTAANTFSSAQTTFNANVNLSSGVLASGSAGTNGFVLTSGGAGTAPTWAVTSAVGAGIVSPGTFTWTNTQGISVSTISISTVPYTNEVPYRGSGGYLVANTSFTYGEPLGGQTGIENLKMEGLSPFQIMSSSNAMGWEFFDDYHLYQSVNMWGGFIFHPNAFPAIAQGNWNQYVRDGGFFAFDVTAPSTRANATGFFQFRYAAPADEATPRTALQINSTGQILIDGMYENCSTIGGITQQSGPQDLRSILMTSSTLRGSLPYPQMTNTQRNAISSPKDGLGVWNNTNHTPDLFVSGQWSPAALLVSTQTFTGTNTFNTVKVIGSAAPPDSQALCLLSGQLGHCTTVVGAGGGCTCSAP
jgi:hypothetical protein